MRLATMLALGGLLFLTNALAAPVAAQEQFSICRGAELNFTPILSQRYAQERRADNERNLETKAQRVAREERARLAACERMKAPDNTPFSHYGYQHNAAHCYGWIKQLQESAGGSCCSSEYSGECRVTEYDALTRSVKIDGVMCPVSGDTRWGVVSISPGLVLACAVQVLRNTKGEPVCPHVHCVGRPPGT